MVGIKDIRGLFYLNRDRNATLTTTKVMILNHIRLMRLHEKEKIQQQQEKEAAAKQDSVKKDSIRQDSIRVEDGKRENIQIISKE